MERFAKAIGTDIRGAVVAKTIQTGNKLAFATEPFGIKPESRLKAQRSIEGDVHKVFLLHAHTMSLLKKISVNIAASYHVAVKEGDYAEAARIAARFLNRSILTGGNEVLEGQRNRKGRVRDGNDSVLSRDKTKVLSYKEKVMKTAGLSKGGWYAAVADIREAKARRPIKWLRHPSSSGTGTIKGGDWGTEVTLVNNVPYAARNLKASKLHKALKEDTRNFENRMNRTIANANAKK